MPPSRRIALLTAAWITLQVVVAAARLDLDTRPPTSSRFSWSMFAGRPIARCTHTLSWRDRAGVERSMPLPPDGHPVRRVLVARSDDEFARVVPLLTAYADHDDDVVEALHALLRRHRDLVDPTRAHTLASTLHCRTWEGHTFRRVLRLEAR